MNGEEYYNKIIAEVRLFGYAFKALRENMTSFFDPEFVYSLSAPSRARGRSRQADTDGMLHAASIPSETLQHGSWPCRLFEVALERPFVARGSLRASKSITIVRELPSWLVFGPNGRAVAAFLAALQALDPAGRARALEEARKSLTDMQRNVALEKMRFEAVYAERDGGLNAAQNAADAAAWNMNRFLAIDAVSAIVLADVIPKDVFNLLYQPLQGVLPIEEIRALGVKSFPSSPIV